MNITVTAAQKNAVEAAYGEGYIQTYVTDFCERVTADKKATVIASKRVKVMALDEATLDAVVAEIEAKVVEPVIDIKG